MTATVSANPFANQLFSPFYRPVMQSATDALNALAASPVIADDSRGGVREQLESALARKVEMESFRVLISDFHEHRQRWGLPSDAESTTALDRYSALLTSESVRADILTRHPVLAKNLEVVQRNFVRSVEELIDHYAADLAVLRDEGWIRGDDLISTIVATGSDSHNGGRQVFIVTQESGVKIVYKPRPLAIDRFVRTLFERVSEVVGVSLDRCVPRVLDRGEHGWQEFIQADRSVTTEEAERYFYRFGVTTMVLGAIGTSDMHHENVVACGEYPCFVDVETALRPDNGVLDDSLAHLLVNRMKQAPTTTMLLPIQIPNGPFDVILAGIGVPREQVSERKSFQMSDRDTDAVSVFRKTFTYNHSDNLVRIGTAVVDPLDHFETIRSGYLACFEAIRSGRIDIDGVFDLFPELPVRYLVRATTVYAQFIDAATHPDYLSSPDEYGRLLGLLKAPSSYNDAGQEFITSTESADMHNRDVPYFSVDAGSRRLGTRSVVGPEVFDRSPRSITRDSITALRETSGLVHEFVLEESLNELVGEGVASPLWKSGVFASTLRAGPTPQAGEAVAEIVSELAHRHEDPDGPQVGWVYGGGGPSSPTLVPGTLVAFHDGGGIPVFLDRAAGAGLAASSFAEAAARGHQRLAEEYRNVLRDSPESVFSGEAGALFGAVPLMDNMFDELLTTIWDRFEAGTAETDVAGGVAGVLLMLSAQHTDRRVLRGRAADLVAEAPRRLWAAEGHSDRAWFDLAHGRLGTAWAAARAADSTGDDRLLGEVADWIIAALDTDSHSEGGEFKGSKAWCAGSAGVALVAGEVLTRAGRIDALPTGRMSGLLDHMTTIKTTNPADLSVCHGGSGVIQSLLALQPWLLEDELLARAVDYRDRLYSHAVAHGYSTGTAGKTSTLGYMLGWAGIGDTDVLLGRAAAGDNDQLIPVALNGVR
ncbi:type 2 lanthipeptide synthetase LanM [Gordonia rubripertincta]|uniref:Type 2 lanthipeptide synthetase LanM n=1 Tax=Gordonia rubripertincta TaxID=36822 RepID=A0ABT4MRW1_GORRU|nr:type 2 lanthipeptide synthetase LanM [Gordonia rubripertincta]MCZ4549754.1 type 2 lanthipeptide synthetase LanM [Gordonia rubripertincta]